MNLSTNPTQALSMLFPKEGKVGELPYLFADPESRFDRPLPFKKLGLVIGWEFLIVFLTKSSSRLRVFKDILDNGAIVVVMVNPGVRTRAISILKSKGIDCERYPNLRIGNTRGERQFDVADFFRRCEIAEGDIACICNFSESGISEKLPASIITIFYAHPGREKENRGKASRGTASLGLKEEGNYAFSNSLTVIESYLSEAAY